jgi:uncharacterized membrane-anchored protein
MNVDTIIGYMAGIFTALVALLVKHFLDRRQASQVHQRDRRQAACDRFRAAISQEISLWHRLDADSRAVIGSLNRRLPELQNSSIIAALIEFRPFVKKNAEEYDKARKSYEKYKKDVSGDRWGFVGSHSVPLKLLEALLHFSDE